MTTTTGPWGPIGSLTRQGERATLEYRRSYPFDVPEVWDAITDFDRLARWFERAEGDRAVGGAVHIYMEPELTVDLVIDSCDAPNGFTAQWHHPGQDMSHVALRIAAVGVHRGNKLSERAHEWAHDRRGAERGLARDRATTRGTRRTRCEARLGWACGMGRRTNRWRRALAYRAGTGAAP